jgi:hypothetical protein
MLASNATMKDAERASAYDYAPMRTVALFVSTLGNRTAASRARLEHLQRVVPSGVQLHLMPGVTDGPVHVRQYQHLRRLIAAVRQHRDDTDLAIVADDDFEPRPNFVNELLRSVHVLPATWRMLHLCPGFLWGRANVLSNRLRPLALSVNLVRWDSWLAPESLFASLEAKDVRLDSTRRVVTNFADLSRAHQSYEARFALGGPIAFTIRPADANHVLMEYDAAYERLKNAPNDIVLSNMSGADDYVQYRPYLCVEKRLDNGQYR